MSALPLVVCSLAVMCASLTAGRLAGAAGQVPSFNRVEWEVVENAVRFTAWYSDTSKAWGQTLSKSPGWTMQGILPWRENVGQRGNMYVVGDLGSPRDTVTVYRLVDAEWPSGFVHVNAGTPALVYERLQFGSTRLAFDVPVSALGDTVQGMPYKVRTYSLTPDSSANNSPYPVAQIKPDSVYDSTVGGAERRHP